MLKKFLLMIIFLLILNTKCLAVNMSKEERVKQDVVTEENGLICVGLAICSDASTDFTDGKELQAQFGHHSWIAITNLGNVSLQINGITLKIFETITIGAWKSVRHNGIFYNVERYYADKGEFSWQKSAYKVQLLNDFEWIYLISMIGNPKTDTWSLTQNCAFFAEKIWNLFADTRISAGIIKCPLKLYENLLADGGKKGYILSSSDKELYYGGKNPVKFEL